MCQSYFMQQPLKKDNFSFMHIQLPCTILTFTLVMVKIV